MTFRNAWLAVALGLSASMAWASSMVVGGGVLSVGGGSLTADAFQLGRGAELRGNGTLRAPAFLAGSVSPGTSVSNIGTLFFSGDVTFQSGTYLCHADGNTTLDKIQAAGNVTGSATVQMSKKSSHVIPLWQIIIQGAAGSGYGGFAPFKPASWRVEPTNTLDLMVTDLRGDTNADGMPDWWEQWYFNGRTAAGVSGNPDNDRSPNLHEYRAGTDPTDILSVLEIETTQLTTNGVVLQWQSVTSKVYCLMSCDAALTGAWIQVSKEIPAGAGPSTIYTNTDTPPPRFHAIGVIEP